MLACDTQPRRFSPRAAPPGTVHRILGHATFATTMNLYGGLTAEALRSAADALGSAFEPRPDKNQTYGSA